MDMTRQNGVAPLCESVADTTECPRQESDLRHPV
jgi:hypothetical protein